MPASRRATLVRALRDALADAACMSSGWRRTPTPARAAILRGAAARAARPPALHHPPAARRFSPRCDAAPKCCSAIPLPGIIEAASLRHAGRERRQPPAAAASATRNTIDCEADASAIAAALRQALQHGRYAPAATSTATAAPASASRSCWPRTHCRAACWTRRMPTDAASSIVRATARAALAALARAVAAHGRDRRRASCCRGRAGRLAPHRHRRRPAPRRCWRGRRTGATLATLPAQPPIALREDARRTAALAADGPAPRSTTCRVVDARRPPGGPGAAAASCRSASGCRRRTWARRRPPSSRRPSAPTGSRRSGPHVDALRARARGLRRRRPCRGARVPARPRIHLGAAAAGRAAGRHGVLLVADLRRQLQSRSCTAARGRCSSIPSRRPGTCRRRALERAFDWAQREGRLPRCVIVVNLYGQSADMDALLPLCERYGVPVLEDAAESLGAHLQGPAPAARFGRIGVFSFNGNKIITTSGGGMLVSRRRGAGRARAQAGDAGARAGAALRAQRGRLQLPHEQRAGRHRPRPAAVLDAARRSARARSSSATAQALADLPRHRVGCPSPPCGASHPLAHAACTLRAATRRRDARRTCCAALERHSIEARPVWKPMHLQPLFARRAVLPHAEGDDVSAAPVRRAACACPPAPT